MGELREARLVGEIQRCGANAIVFQHHPVLMPWSGVESVFAAPQLKGCTRVITLHNVKDLLFATSAEDMQAAIRSLRLADRVLVHTVNDLNLLKSFGLVENVTLFPHGACVFEGREQEWLKLI